MATIETVTGPVDAGELGTTLIHEHLRTRDEAVHEQWPQAKASGGIPEREHPGDGHAAAVEVATAAVELGVRTICDPTAMFLGRDVSFMRDVSERTGLQVVPCTGIYTYDHLPPFFVSRDADAIADLFCADIEQGIQGTEIKAAFLKCAADEPGVTENIEKVHRAAARASVRTGAPIMAHSRPASDTGPRQVEIFLEEGVDPAKVQVAHTGDTDDLDYIERLLETGVWIGLDRYGLEMYLPFDRRQATAQGAARARLRRPDLPLRGLLRDDRLVRAGGDRADARRRDGEGLGHPDRARAGAPGAARGGDDRRSGRADLRPQPGRLARGLSSALRPRPAAPRRPGRRGGSPRGP